MREGTDGYDDTSDEELQAKFAEADFLGRVMAHAYTQELQKIAEEGAEVDEEELVEALRERPDKKTLQKAIERLGGKVEEKESAGDAGAYVNKLAEARAAEMASEWLIENGFIE